MLALRMAILRKHLGLSLRKFSLALSHSDLYKWFCGINRFYLPKVPGKSAVGELENSIPPALTEGIKKCLLRAIQGESCQVLDEPLDFSRSPMKQKGFEHRHIHMGLSILAHNLWVLGRLKVAQEHAKQQAA